MGGHMFVDVFPKLLKHDDSKAWMKASHTGMLKASEELILIVNILEDNNIDLGDGLQLLKKILLNKSVREYGISSGARDSIKECLMRAGVFLFGHLVANIRLVDCIEAEELEETIQSCKNDNKEN